MKLRYFVFLFVLIIPQINYGGVKGKLNVWKEWVKVNPVLSLFFLGSLAAAIRKSYQYYVKTQELLNKRDKAEKTTEDIEKKEAEAFKLYEDLIGSKLYNINIWGQELIKGTANEKKFNQETEKKKIEFLAFFQAKLVDLYNKLAEEIPKKDTIINNFTRIESLYNKISKKLYYSYGGLKGVEKLREWITKVYLKEPIIEEHEKDFVGKVKDLSNKITYDTTNIFTLFLNSSLIPEDVDEHAYDQLSKQKILNIQNIINRENSNFAFAVNNALQ